MLQIQKRLSNSFFGLLSLPATAMGFALSVQISALSWILTTKYNLDLHEIGIVWAAGPIAGIVGQVVIGLLSDNTWFWGGRRRPFILIGGTIAALMLLALPNIDKINDFFGVNSLILVAIVVALMLDVAINISFNPTRSLISDVTPEGSERTKGYTWMQTVSGFFGVLAYIIGAVWGNYYLIYFGIILVLVFSVLPTFLIVEPRDLKASSGIKETEGEGKTDLSGLMKIYIAHGFSWIAIQTMFVYIIAFIQQKINPGSDNETGRIISISFAVLNTVGFILPAFVLQPLAERFGRIKVHTISISFMALAYFGMVIAGHSEYVLYILMGIAGIGWSSVVSLPFAIMSEKVEKGKMGLYMGIFNLSVVIPQLIVSLVIGYFISQAPDKNIIFIISGAGMAISVVLWMLIREDRKIKGAN
ncbi:MAG TPA: MFS transporter [Ignavibacteriaceae bacterium]|nr:MFS transporter [Ignavibacteriaceae bacterium]